MSVKPIIFRPDMVRALLDGRKTVTRRVVKITINKGEPVSHVGCNSAYYPAVNKDGVCANFYDVHGFYRGAAKPPYQPGDILYVRETWRNQPLKWSRESGYSDFELQYRADFTDEENDCYGRCGGVAPWKWLPPIHMPKAAARIFLRVTGVRVERLKDITKDQIIKAGVKPPHIHGYLTELYQIFANGRYIENEDPHFVFWQLWDSTIKPAELETYGWNANPYVWVIEFERCEKPEVFL